jgi:hypothetical protein
MKRSKFSQADHKGGNDDCLTPQNILEIAEFDLDPCFGHPRPWSTAKTMWALEDGQNGLEREWFGHVWLNQPYSQAGLWAKRMSGHGDGVMLVFARTETKWFQAHVLCSPTASSILFLDRRLQFCQPNGKRIRTESGRISNAGAPSCLVSYGSKCFLFLQRWMQQRGKHPIKYIGRNVRHVKGVGSLVML